MKALDFIVRGFLFLVFSSRGMGHFLETDFYIKMVPPYIPFPEAVVLVTGFFEIIMAVGIMIPELKEIAAKFMVFFLFCYLPALFHMIGSKELFPEIASQLMIFTLPAQFLMIVMAWYISGMHSPMYFFLKVVDPEELEPENQPPPDEEDDEDKVA